MKINYILTAFFCFSFSLFFGQIEFEKNLTLDKLKAKAKKEKNSFLLMHIPLGVDPVNGFQQIFLQIKMSRHSTIKILSMRSLIWRTKVRDRISVHYTK